VTDPETLVHRYLGELDEAATDLPTDRRIELVSEVRGHIELALAEAGSTDEETVRAILDRLGPADEIVAAESVPNDAPTTLTATRHVVQPRPEPRRLTTEARALLLFTIGAASCRSSVRSQVCGWRRDPSAGR
jgi:HAAS